MRRGFRHVVSQALPVGAEVRTAYDGCMTRRSYRTFLPVLIIVTAVVSWSCARYSSGIRAKSSEHPDWGVYQIYWGSQRFQGKLDDALSTFASKPDYIMYYRDMGRPFPADGIQVIRDAGATAIISLELWRWHDSKTRQLPRILAGEWDAFFRKWATDAKRFRGRVLLRFGFEFNGDWFSWGGEPELFVEAWRRARGIFDDVGADNVEWVWAANITSHPGGPENDMHRYYPGDALVDWVAVDGYNWGDDHEPWHTWTSFEKLFESPMREFAKRYPSKPVMIAEFGCPEGDDGQKAAWIRAAYRTAKHWPQLKALVWFNLDKRREGELNFRIDSSPESLQAFNETFAASRGDGG